jgi:hypothetical protein
MTRPTVRLAALATATAAALLAACVPCGAARAGSLARVDVYDRTLGEALPTFRRAGRQYVAGQPGNEYAIRIRNCSNRRVLAVVSVDGVNVVTGETADPDQSGYVIEPGDYVNIAGWRKDLNRTAAFYFTDPSDSYASRTGRPDDLGVIGVALFSERVHEVQLESRDAAASELPAPARSEARRAGTAKSAGSVAQVPAAEASLGTGHGRREDSPAQWVAFERDSNRPDQVVRIRYERRERLVAMGVLPATPRHRDDWREPNPFPGDTGFVPDP